MHEKIKDNTFYLGETFFLFPFPFYKTFTIWRRFEQIFFFLSNKFVITDSKIDTFYCYSSITPLFIIIDWREKYIKIKIFENEGENTSNQHFLIGFLAFYSFIPHHRQFVILALNFLKNLWNMLKKFSIYFCCLFLLAAVSE